jgi:hypothetical protein
MASSPKFPGPTQQEKELQGEQTALLRQQRDILNEQLRRQELLAPVLYKQAGIAPQYDASGNITGFAELPNTDTLKDLRQDIEKRFLERTQAALKGELPEDPGLLRQLQEGETQLNESLSRQLGPGYATSTPGIEALSNFQKRKSELLDAARRGDLTLAEQLGLARGAANMASNTAEMGLESEAIRSPFQGGQGFGNLAALYNSPLQLGLAQRQGQFQANYQRFLNSPLNRFLLNPLEQFQMSSAQSAGQMAGRGGMGMAFG